MEDAAWPRARALANKLKESAMQAERGGRSDLAQMLYRLAGFTDQLKPKEPE